MSSKHIFMLLYCDDLKILASLYHPSTTQFVHVLYVHCVVMSDLSVINIFDTSALEAFLFSLYFMLRF